MYGRFKDHLGRRAREDPGARPLQEGARPRDAPGRRDPDRDRGQGPQLLRQQLSGLLQRAPGHGRRQLRLLPLGLRPGLGPLHLRHPAGPQGARSGGWPASWAWTTPSSIPRPSTPTAASSSPSSTRTAPSSPTSSTTPRSSTASGWPRPSGSSTGTTTWTTSRTSSSRPAKPSSSSSSRTASSPWTASSPRSTRSATWPTATTPWSWSTTPTPRASSARRAAAPTSTAGVMDRVDIIVTTFGKALGGASGGCVAGRREIVEFLRQRSRPYLFSNSLAPAIAGATVEVLKILEESTELRERLMANTRLFRKGMEDAGFRIVPGIHPIVPVLFGHLPERRPASARTSPTPSSRRGSTSSASTTRSSPGQVPDPGPDQRRPHPGADRLRPRQVRQGRQGASGAI